MAEILINKEIPRTMTLAGLNYLGHLARTVPKNGLIVEVGPLFGSSTWVLAKNADPSVRVISIDTWEPAQWIDAVEAKFPGCKNFSKDAFLYYTRDCPNVTAVQGYSPGIMGDWNEPIDLFFDDATHGNPGFTESLNFFLPKLKPGGVASGDDYASGWPDIVQGVSTLGADWGSRPEIIGRLWAIVKPGGGADRRSVYSIAGPYSDHDLKITVRTSDGQTTECTPGAWAGNLHQHLTIEGVMIDWARPRGDGLTGAYQVLGKTGAGSRWVRFGEWAGGVGPIRAFRGHLLGAANAGTQLGYQACCVINGKRNRLYTRNTRAFREGAWTELEAPATPDKDGKPRPAPKAAGVSALRVFVETPDTSSDE